MKLEGKRILITGGTGSLGKVLIRRLLSLEMGTPRQIIVFSRDEAKQYYMRMEYRNQNIEVNDFLYRNFQALVTFRIGDVRDFHSISAALRDVDIVFHTAALKQVPTCEYFPHEAVLTNIIGAQNIVQAIREHHLSVETVVGISTDKACKPVNVMGMTKAIQERLLINANIECADTRFICVRYGNVLASRGSVLPLFHEQIKSGGPVTITAPEMTRFLLDLNRAVDTIFEAVQNARRGEIYIPNVGSARVIDLANVLIGARPIMVKVIGVRPGEKIHEILVSEEEAYRTVARNSDYYVILPILPELADPTETLPHLTREFSSADNLLTPAELVEMLRTSGMRIEDRPDFEKDLLVS